MERLTVMTDKGAALKMGGSYESEQAARDDLMKRYRVAVARLAVYEDTGLEPEEIRELCTDDVAKIAKLFRHMIEDGSIDHLRALLEAEKDGRLVPVRHGRWGKYAGKLVLLRQDRHGGGARLLLRMGRACLLREVEQEKRHVFVIWRGRQ